MLDVRFYTQDGLRLTMQGHAGYAPEGADIVCAGASALFSTLENVLALCGADVRARDAPGDCEIVCAEPDRTVRDAFRFTFVGLMALSRAYPAHVRIAADVPMEEWIEKGE